MSRNAQRRRGHTPATTRTGRAERSPSLATAMQRTLPARGRRRPRRQARAAHTRRHRLFRRPTLALRAVRRRVWRRRGDGTARRVDHQDGPDHLSLGAPARDRTHPPSRRTRRPPATRGRGASGPAERPGGRVLLPKIAASPLAPASARRGAAHRPDESACGWKIRTRLLAEPGDCRVDEIEPRPKPVAKRSLRARSAGAADCPSTRSRTARNRCGRPW